MPPETENKNNSPTPNTTGNPPQTSPAQSFLKQIRTFQGDVANALQDQRESLYSIQQTERLKQASGATVPSVSTDNPEKRKQFFLLFLGSFLLIALGGTGAWLGYNEYLRKTAPPVLAVPDNRFITAQSTAEVNLAGSSRDTLIKVVSENGSDVSQGELKHLVLRLGSGDLAPLVTAQEFFTILGGTAPGNLIRSFEPLFMFGSLGESRFIIFKLSSFENAFGGMLTWEKTMANDLGPLFETSPLLTNIAPESVFKDIVSRNKDARVLYAPVDPGSATTTPVLLYSFLENKMLIITDSLLTLQTLLDRLTQESLSR